MSQLRKLARGVARKNIETKIGKYTRMNKQNMTVFAGLKQDGTFEERKLGSSFARHWREYVPVNRDEINARRDAEKALARLKKRHEKELRKARKVNKRGGSKKAV